MNKNILITGLPGCGKTTLVIKLTDILKPLRPLGFYTSEIREGETRLGFELVGVDGRKSLLAHVDIQSHIRVGKYRVDIDRFENFLDKLDLDSNPQSPVIIDEIGKMECFSPKFAVLVESILSSPRQLIASVAARGGGLIDAVKKRNDIVLLQLSRTNQEPVIEKIRLLIQK